MPHRKASELLDGSSAEELLDSFSWPEELPEEEEEIPEDTSEEEELPEEKEEISEETSEEEELPEEKEEVSEEEETPEEIDESQLSPAELYEKGQMEAAEAQAEAEQWADEQGMSQWSDGTERQNYDATEETDAQTKADADAQAEADAEAQAAEEEAQLIADIEAKNNELNSKYIDLMNRKNAAFDSTVDATNVEDRERFANEQYEIGQEMDRVRQEMIDNNNRRK